MGIYEYVTKTSVLYPALLFTLASPMYSNCLLSGLLYVNSLIVCMIALVFS